MENRNTKLAIMSERGFLVLRGMQADIVQTDEEIKLSYTRHSKELMKVR